MLVAILDRQHQLPKISECLLIHMLSKHVNRVCMSAVLSDSNISRIGKHLDRDKCFLLYLKLKLSFMETDRSLPGPLDFGMRYRYEIHCNFIVSYTACNFNLGL